jgi:steroid delta-isomerase-like uncharacterized protein
MTIDQTRAIIESYAAGHDPQYLAEDAVFTDLTSGQTHEGRDAVAGMLHHVYHVAFDARAEEVSLTVGEGRATLEAVFVGRHVGDFAGIPATGREVRVPLSVSYDIAKDGIKRARIYMLASVMMQQLGVAN